MLDIRFYLKLLFQRLPYLIFFVFVGASAGVTVAMILPPSYTAEAQLVVERQQISDDLAASTVQTGTGEQLEIIRQRILTRANLLDLAEEFGIYDRAAEAALSPGEMVNDMRSRVRIRTTGTQHNRNRGVEATLINVSFEAEDAQMAAEVTNEIVTLILQENVEMRTEVTGQTLDFFEREVERLDEALAEAGRRISVFQRENSGALPESLDFRREQLLAGQERVAAIDREIAQLRESRRNAETLYEQTGSALAFEDTLSPEARELQALRDRYTLDAAVLSEQNPRLVMMRQQIEALESVVSGQDNTSGEGQQNRVTTAFQRQLLEIDSQIADLEQQREVLSTRIESLSASIEATPDNAVTLARLERDLTNLQRQYDNAAVRKAQAETGDTIEALSKGQRISIIENAQAPDSPTSPDRPKIAILGFAGGLAAGLGLIALLELMNTSVRRAVELERALDITPIATLSYMRTRSEILRRRAVIATAFVVIGIGLPAGLWATHTFVQPLDSLARAAVERMPPAVGETLRSVF